MEDGPDNLKFPFALEYPVQPAKPTIPTLVLVGGGHSHAIVLRQWAKRPLLGVRLILISDRPAAPYSGMLPGYLAGYYRFADCHIDLPKLAQVSGAEFRLDRVVGLDLQAQTVHCATQPPLAYDWLSINIGSTPDRLQVSGANDHAIPAKPVPELITAWETWLQTLSQSGLQSGPQFGSQSEELGFEAHCADLKPQVPNDPTRTTTTQTLAIVGGGAGGVELALALQAKLRSLGLTNFVQVHLIHRGAQLLQHHSPALQRQILGVLQQRGIHVHCQETIVAIQPQSTPLQSAAYLLLKAASGWHLSCDRVIWVTQASAPGWPRAAGLQTDDRGFILVSDTLQSLSHPNVFAAGDIATQVDYPRPKAGVFAVRQGRPLFQNLQAVLQGHSPEPFEPQRHYLVLIGTGDRQALASRGQWSLGPSPLLWWLKDWIDRRFMQQFT